MPKTPVTECERELCRMTGHVVLYAAGGQFDGREYRRGQTVVYCLRHGGELYDAIHRRGELAIWIRPHTNGAYPTVRAPWQSVTPPTSASSKYQADGWRRKPRGPRMPDTPPARNYR